MDIGDYDGTEVFTYTVSDGELTSAPATITVVVTDAPNLAPRFVDPTPEDGPAFEVEVGEEFTFIAAAEDPDAGPMALTFELDGAPEASLFDADTGVFSWTPTREDADTELTLLVRATDGLATVERGLEQRASAPDAPHRVARRRAHGEEA